MVKGCEGCGLNRQLRAADQMQYPTRRVLFEGSVFEALPIDAVGFAWRKQTVSERLLCFRQHLLGSGVC